MERWKIEHRGFSLKKKKRKSSTQSIGLEDESKSGTPAKRTRRSSISRIGSLMNFVSPVKPVRAVAQAMKKSFSLRSLKMNTSSSSLTSTASLVTPSVGRRKPLTAIHPTGNNNASQETSAPILRGSSRARSVSCGLWSESIGKNLVASMNRPQILRQEAVHELVASETQYLTDLRLLVSTCLPVLTETSAYQGVEVIQTRQLFNSLQQLLIVHNDLMNSLSSLRSETSLYRCPDHSLSTWLSAASPVMCRYCSRLVHVYPALHNISDSPLLSELDAAWRSADDVRERSLLEILEAPRNRLVKYPLLLRAILKRVTLQSEALLLNTLISEADEAVKQVDSQIGVSKAQFVSERLVPTPNIQFSIDPNTQLLCEGVLKDTRAMKVHCFLFEHQFLLTRRVATSRRRKGSFSRSLNSSQTTQTNQILGTGRIHRYQPYVPPVPTDTMQVTPSPADSCSIEIRASGSDSKPLVLQCRDQHHRHMWISQLNAAKSLETLV